MLDYHVHPGYSIDAEPVSIESYCYKAIEIGLKEICFTTHCEFDPHRKHIDWFVRLKGRKVPMHPPAYWLNCYFEEILRCRSEFKNSGLKVKIGLEVGYDLGLERTIEKVTAQYPFDFIIGSIHCLNHVAISSAKESSKYFLGRSVQQVMSCYFNKIKEMIKCRLFDVIGHLDIYRRHGTSYLKGLETAHEQYIGEIFDLMLQTKIGMELNTSSLRNNQGAFYPGNVILGAAVAKGIKYFTVGSDCHRLSDLGRGITKAIETLKNYGITPVVYEKRVPRLFSESFNSKEGF